MRKSILKYSILTAIILTGAASSYCQSDSPEVLKQGTISEQFKYLDDHTRIYENYRAIREDMFRSISRNTLDTLKKTKSTIDRLILNTSTLNNRIDSLKQSLEATNSKLEKTSRTKDAISVLGLNVNKKAYNGIMWTILAALVLLLIIGFLSYKHNRAVTLRTKKDLADLKEEFEEYHKTTRLERERMNLEHFNEIKRLKGG